MKQFRIITSFILMLLGVAMIVRGIQNSMQRGLGWQGMLMSSVLGMLVCALGFIRWRYLRQR